METILVVVYLFTTVATVVSAAVEHTSVAAGMKRMFSGKPFVSFTSLHSLLIASLLEIETEYSFTLIPLSSG